MKKYTVQEIIDIYEDSGKKIYEASLEGDYKTCNKEVAKLTKIFKYFETNKDFGEQCIMELLKSKNVVVASKAAAYCLSLKTNIESAEKKLYEISLDDTYGIYQLNAEMTLKVWEEQGYLKIYPKQQIG